MAVRTSVLQTTTFTEPGYLDLTDAQRKAEFLLIRLTINNRPPNIGVFDATRLIPRVWTGFWWLLNKNSVESHGNIEFENQTIYRRREEWKAEVQTVVALTLVEIPNSEPATIAEQTAVFNALTSYDDNLFYYFPFPHPIDRLGLWFPAGAVVSVAVEHWPWSDVPNLSGNQAALDVEAEILEQGETPLAAIAIPEQKPIPEFCKDVLDIDEGGTLCSSFYDLGRTLTVNGRLIIDRSPGIPSAGTPYVAYEVGATFLLSKGGNPVTISVTSTGTVTAYATESDAVNNVSGTVDTNNSQQWGCGYRRVQGSVSG